MNARWSAVTRNEGFVERFAVVVASAIARRVAYEARNSTFVLDQASSPLDHKSGLDAIRGHIADIQQIGKTSQNRV